MLVRQRSDRAFVIRENPVETTPIMRVALQHPMQLPDAIARCQRVKATGIDCYVSDNYGGEYEYADSTPAPQVVRHESITYRGITPREVRPDLYVIDFEINGGKFTISGTSPDEALTKFFSDELSAASSQLRQYIATLPDPDFPQAVAPVPVAETIPARILRSADRDHMNDRPAPRPVVPSTATPPAHIVYAAWERNASVAQLKDRLRSDPAFSAWYQSQNVV